MLRQAAGWTVDNIHWLVLAALVSTLVVAAALREGASSVYLAIAIVAAIAPPLVVLPSPVRDLGVVTSGAVVACSGALISIHLGFPAIDQGPTEQSMMSVLLLSLMGGSLALGAGRLHALREARRHARALETRLAQIQATQDEIIATLGRLPHHERVAPRRRWLRFRPRVNW